MAQGDEAKLTLISFVEYETAADLAAAVEKLDGQEFKGATVRCVSDVGCRRLPFGHVFLTPHTAWKSLITLFTCQRCVASHS